MWGRRPVPCTSIHEQVWVRENLSVPVCGVTCVCKGHCMHVSQWVRAGGCQQESERGKESNAITTPLLGQLCSWLPGAQAAAGPTLLPQPPRRVTQY